MSSIDHVLRLGSLAPAALALLVSCSSATPMPPERPVAVDIAAPERPERPPLRLAELSPDAETQPAGELEVGDETVRFVNARVDATSSYAAVGVVGQSLRWLDLHTDAERAAGASPESGWAWVHFAVAPDGQTLVGVLDWFVESSGPTLHIVASTDGGRTWSQRAEIEKPHYMALFEGLEMGVDAWHLVISLDDCGGCGVPAGMTAWVSDDAGWSWKPAR